MKRGYAALLPGLEIVRMEHTQIVPNQRRPFIPNSGRALIKENVPPHRVKRRVWGLLPHLPLKRGPPF